MADTVLALGAASGHSTLWFIYSAALCLGSDAEFSGPFYGVAKLQNYTVNIALGDLVRESAAVEEQIRAGEEDTPFYSCSSTEA